MAGGLLDTVAVRLGGVVVVCVVLRLGLQLLASATCVVACARHRASASGTKSGQMSEQAHHLCFFSLGCVCRLFVRIRVLCAFCTHSGFRGTGNELAPYKVLCSSARPCTLSRNAFRVPACEQHLRTEIGLCWCVCLARGNTFNAYSRFHSRLIIDPLRRGDHREGQRE